MIEDLTTKTPAERIAYVLRISEGPMTAQGLRERCKLERRPMGELLEALDRLTAADLVRRYTAIGTRATYQWVGGKQQLHPALAASIDGLFSGVGDAQIKKSVDRLSLGPSSKPRNPNYEAVMDAMSKSHGQPVKVVSQSLKMDREKAPHPKPLQTAVLKLFADTPTQIHKGQVAAKLPGLNAGSVVTTLSTLRREGKLVETPTGFLFRLDHQVPEPADAQAILAEMGANARERRRTGLLKGHALRNQKRNEAVAAHVHSSEADPQQLRQRIADIVPPLDPTPGGVTYGGESEPTVGITINHRVPTQEEIGPLNVLVPVIAAIVKDHLDIMELQFNLGDAETMGDPGIRKLVDRDREVLEALKRPVDPISDSLVLQAALEVLAARRGRLNAATKALEAVLAEGLRPLEITFKNFDSGPSQAPEHPAHAVAKS